jgi:DNA mismatch repair ATPase MutS
MLNNIFNTVFSKKKSNIPYSGTEPKDEDFDFDLIEHYFKHKVQTEKFQIINNQIINDIDFYELFMFLDRTHSKIGQQYLYNRLLTIDRKIEFDEQEQLIAYFIENEEIKLKIQSLLSKLSRREVGYISNLFLDGYITKPKWFWIIGILSVVSFAALVLTILYNKLFTLLLSIYLVNMGIHFWNKKNIMGYMDSIPQLSGFCKIAKKIAQMNILPASEHPVLLSVKSILELKNGIKFFKLDTGLQSDFENVVKFVWEVTKILFLIEPLIVFDVLKKLEGKRNDIQTIFEYLGKIDSAMSVASIRQEASRYCKPVFSDTIQPLEFTDIYHPLISGCISNSLKLSGKSILLTGSNMSGKTTFIRTIAVNLLLAQTINSCFADHFKLPPTRLFSAIRITDDLLNDKSYYFEEVLTIKNMINESQSGFNNVFFLDEIFKGTNTIERIAAGKAVLSYLAKSDKNKIFVSTHDIELADLLSSEYDLYHFTEVIQNEQIHFDYKLKQGNLSTKNAIRILEINDYPKEIVVEARIISQLFQKKSSNFGNTQ